MEQLRLRVRLLPRALRDERDEIDQLVEPVRAAIRSGGGGSAAVVVRPDRFELVDLGGLGPVPLHHFLGGLTRSTAEGVGPPEAVGVVGRFRLRRRGQAEQPVAVAFLEWPDCRWALWQVMLDGRSSEVPGSEIIRSAADGDALPDGLGRWWTLGRRLKMTVRFGPVVRPPLEPSSLVH